MDEKTGKFLPATYARPTEPAQVMAELIATGLGPYSASGALHDRRAKDGIRA